jgi:uncharacterized protein
MRPMPYRESALFFDCGGDALLGVVSTPAERADTGVVIVVGGPQYRVGSHRQFTSLARTLASAGIACLRFDYRGMGDSLGTACTFESIDDDIAAAVDVLQRETNVGRVVLWGLCDGASAAIMYAPRDARIAAVVAVNPWVRTASTEASTRLRHYYLQRVASRAFWKKLVRGKVDAGAALRGLAEDARRSASKPAVVTEHFLSRMHDSWTKFPGRTLFILSGNDLTAREFEAWVDADEVRRNAFRGDRCEVRRVVDADHTFSRRETLRHAEASAVDWIGAL